MRDREEGKGGTGKEELRTADAVVMPAIVAATVITGGGAHHHLWLNYNQDNDNATIATTMDVMLAAATD